MSHLPALSRRGFVLGLAAAASAPGARLALADAPGEARLVVVLLRGALDGLAAAPPYGDPAYAALRGEFAGPLPGQEGGMLDLGGFYGLHPELRALHAMFRAGEATVVHAVAGHWRTRSHFDAQDMLENGFDARTETGWLNRALSALPQRPPGQPALGLALGLDMPLLMRGPAAVGAYAPPNPGTPSPDLMARFAALYATDAQAAAPFAEGLRARGFTSGELGEEALTGRGGFPALAGVAGRLLAAPAGPRVAALEIGGWDTHAFQPQRLPPVLRQLDNGLGLLRATLGPAWRRTAVLVATEFGRTAAINGSQGTDHGTGGAAFLLGGAVAGGRVLADWPGIAPGQLFERRDLAATRDLRALAKALLRQHLGLPEAAVLAAFPGSEAVAPEAGLLRG
jgi:uncharacterized protein (DUF1501 family)